jgi:hypothetical protein
VAIARVAEVLESWNRRVSERAKRRMTTKQLRDGAQIAAIHEAGHAVVAVYLGVPVDRVQLSSYWVDPLSIFRRSDLSGGGVSYLPSATSQHAEHAIISAAARVAVDDLIRPGAHPETAYSDDEDCLKEIAGELEITDFQPWRAGVLERAREIISIDYVRVAIRRVAGNLQAAPLEDGLTGEQVREVLRAEREK